MHTELEATLPRWLQSKSWYPPFVHILKVGGAGFRTIWRYNGRVPWCLSRGELCFEENQGGQPAPAEKLLQMVVSIRWLYTTLCKHCQDGKL